MVGELVREKGERGQEYMFARDPLLGSFPNELATDIYHFLRM